MGSIPHLFSDGVAQTHYRRDGGTLTLGTSRLPTSPIPRRRAMQTVAIAAGSTTMPGRSTWVFCTHRRIKIRYTPTPGWTFSGSYCRNTSAGTGHSGRFSVRVPGRYNITELPDRSLSDAQHRAGREFARNGGSVDLDTTRRCFKHISTLIWTTLSTGAASDRRAPDAAFYNNTSSATAGSITDANRGPCAGNSISTQQPGAYTPRRLTGRRLPRNPFHGNVLLRLAAARTTIPAVYDQHAITAGGEGCRTSSRCLPSQRGSGWRRAAAHRQRHSREQLFDPLSLKGFYRFYDLDNRSRQLTFREGSSSRSGRPQYGRHSGQLPRPRRREVRRCGIKSIPYAYSKNNVVFDAGYPLHAVLTGTLVTLGRECTARGATF